jgi:hypothetical protein
MGGHTMNTCIFHYEFESFAAMEAAYERVSADPEFQAVVKENYSTQEGGLQIEVYIPLTLE